MKNFMLKVILTMLGSMGIGYTVGKTLQLICDRKGTTMFEKIVCYIGGYLIVNLLAYDLSQKIYEDDSLNVFKEEEKI